MNFGEFREFIPPQPQPQPHSILQQQQQYTQQLEKRLNMVENMLELVVHTMRQSQAAAPGPLARGSASSSHPKEEEEEEDSRRKQPADAATAAAVSELLGIITDKETGLNDLGPGRDSGGAAFISITSRRAAC